jgi:plastocyanin
MVDLSETDVPSEPESHVRIRYQIQINTHLWAVPVTAKEECGMRLRLAAPTILVSTLVISIVAVGCLQTVESVVQTTTAEQKDANRMQTREALIAAGRDPDTEGLVVVGEGSLAQKVQQTSAAIREATQEAGGGQGGEQVTLRNGQLVSAAVATEIAAFGTQEQPLVAPEEGAVESGVILVNIESGGSMNPPIVKITPGSTVRWEWTDRSMHSTKSDTDLAESWDSKAITRGMFDKENPSYEHTFTTPGRYPYGSRVSGDTSDGTIFVIEE